MQNGRTFPIAGPTNHRQVSADIQRARTFMVVRDRIGRAARAAVPPHRRRPAKGDGQWPDRIRLSDL